MDTSRRWLCVADAAAYFSIRPKTLYSLIARGMIPSAAVLRLGKQIRIAVDFVERPETAPRGRK